MKNKIHFKALMKQSGGHFSARYSKRFPPRGNQEYETLGDFKVKFLKKETNIYNNRGFMSILL